MFDVFICNEIYHSFAADCAQKTFTFFDIINKQNVFDEYGWEITICNNITEKKKRSIFIHFHYKQNIL